MTKRYIHVHNRGHSCTCNMVIIHMVLNAIMNPYYTHMYEKKYSKYKSGDQQTKRLDDT